jgi:hypothetical protein
VTFFRQIALLLPSAFLLGVLLFLLTHGRGDPGFGTYPFLDQWFGPEAAARWTPEVRFLVQTAIFFVPAYAVALLLVLAIAVAENALFGLRPEPRPSSYRRSFGSVFSVLFLAACGAIVFWGEKAASRKVPGALLAPLIVGLAPFAAGAVALLPAAVLAAPVALLRKAAQA